MAEEKKIATGYIGNALRSSAADHTTTFADEIFDTERQKYQNEVNTDLEATDNEIKADLEAETARAKAAEEANATAIADEVARAQAAEQVNSQAIMDEATRAKAAEQANATSIIENSNIINCLFDIYEQPSDAQPKISSYSYSASGNLEGYKITLPANTVINANERVGIQMYFQDAYFRDKIFMFKPKFSCTGNIDLMTIVCSKQEGLNITFSVLSNNVNAPIILLDFRESDINVQYYWFRVYIAGIGARTSTETVIEYKNDYELICISSSELDKIKEELKKLEEDIKELPALKTSVITINEDIKTTKNSLITIENDVTLIKNNIDLVKHKWNGSAPRISSYSNATNGTLINEYRLELEKDTVAVSQDRLGIKLTFESDFVGKIISFKPKFKVTGSVESFALSVTKQSNFDGVISIVSSDVNNCEIKFDFTDATASGIRYYYAHIAIIGLGVPVNENSVVEYMEDYSISTIESGRLDKIEDTLSFVNKNIIEKLCGTYDTIPMFVDRGTNNLIDKTKVSDYYIDVNGNQRDSSGYLAETDYIPVKEGETYRINRRSGSKPIWTCWDENKSFISGDDTSAYTYTVPTGQNIKYIRLSILVTEIDTVMLTEGQYVDYNDYFEFGHPRINFKTHLYGKKIATIGDSMTQGQRWQPMLSEYLGMKCTVIAQHGGNMIAIANFIEQLDTDYDILSVWAGGNDYAAGVPVGSITNKDRNTYSGALLYLIEYCYTHFPKTKLLLITSPQRFTEQVTAWEMNERGFYINPTSGHTLEDYANMVVEIASIYAVPVLDICHQSEINRFSIDNYSDDKLHPTPEGFQRIAWKIISKIQTM